jgi:hypothetical protein
MKANESKASRAVGVAALGCMLLAGCQTSVRPTKVPRRELLPAAPVDDVVWTLHPRMRSDVDGAMVPVHLPPPHAWRHRMTL